MPSKRGTYLITAIERLVNISGEFQRIGLSATVKLLNTAAASMLIFTNSRRMTEKITRMINEGEDALIANAHHGSLSKELRKAVEERMKAGNLKATVATNFLELGIDIGALDHVLMIEASFSISSGI